MKPSTAKVLELLRHAGPHGMTTGRFAEARCPRAAARIAELRRAGHVIDSIREEANAYRFILRNVGLGSGMGGAETRSTAVEPGVGPDARNGSESGGPPRNPGAPAASRLFEMPPLTGTHDRTVP